MPKSKSLEKKSLGNDEEKIIDIDMDDKIVDTELIPGEESEDDPEDDEIGFDVEDADPFKDKWEE